MPAIWTTPRTWTAGELVTALIANAAWRDNLMYLKDSPTFDGNVTVTGNATVSGTLTTGALNPISLVVTGPASVGGDLAVGGGVSVGGGAFGLTATGALVATTGAFSGLVTVGGTLSATGNTTITTLTATVGTFSGDIVLTNANPLLRLATADGTDNRLLGISAYNGLAALPTRGASIRLGGNEAGGAASGLLQLMAGDAPTGGTISFYGGAAGALRGTMHYSGGFSWGSVTDPGAANVILGGTLAVTSGATVGGTLGVTGAVTIGGTLVVTGAITGAVPAGTLTGTTLAATVVTSSLTSVGVLNAGSITSGFGSIDIGADALTCGALSASGLLTVTGFGAHAITASGTGGQSFNLANTSNAVAQNFAFYQATSGTTLGRLFAFSQNYVAGGAYDQQASTALVGLATGGVSIAATSAAAKIRCYANGDVQRMQIGAGVTVGDTVDPGATNLRVVGTSQLFGNVGIGIDPGVSALGVQQYALAATPTAFFISSHPDPLGLTISLGVDTNDTGHCFVRMFGNVNVRAEIRSNGGLANYSANNVNLSDATVKRIDGALDSERARWRQLRVVRGAYLDKPDQTHAMVTAQDVEDVYPELVTWFDEAKQLKGVREHGLMMRAFRVIQELDDEVVALRARVEAL